MCYVEIVVLPDITTYLREQPLQSSMKLFVSLEAAIKEECLVSREDMEVRTGTFFLFCATYSSSC